MSIRLIASDMDGTLLDPHSEISAANIRAIKEAQRRGVEFLICSNDLTEDTVIKLKEEFSNFPEIAAASSFPTNIELTHIRAQKGHALKAYAQLKGISLEDVMVLGDSDNDLSMFVPEIGWAVAMENSMDCIRDAAKYHTRSNQEDGVAWAISRYVLEE